MNKIEELIAKHCPEGVSYKPISDCIIALKTGLNPRKNFKLNEDGASCAYITGKDIFNSRINISEKTDMIFPKDVQTINKRAELEKGCLLFVSTGTGTVGRMAMINEYDGNWAISESLYCIKVNTSTILAKFLMYLLYSNYCTAQYKPKISKGSVPHLRIRDLLDVNIPVPPIEVQQEIVRMLDTFTNLKAELQAELQARKEQYEFYKNKLYSFAPDEVEWKRMGDIGTFIRGNGLQKKDFVESGVGCIHYGQIYTYFGTYTDKTKTFVTSDFAKKLRKAKYGDLVIATTSENVEDVCKAVAWLGENEIAISGDAYIFTHIQNPKYLAYLFQTELFFNYKRKAITGTKVMRVSGNSMSNFIIPIPPLEKQRQIVSILEKFDMLVNDLSNGLPAEIEALQQQYEYYRDKLLTFERKA